MERAITGVPIDHYSCEAVELLKDTAARWQNERRLRNHAGCSTSRDSPVCAAIRVPEAEIYAIDVSFAAIPDPTERAYLNQQPTSFVLPAEAVDRLRAAAGTIILASARVVADCDADPVQRRDEVVQTGVASIRTADSGHLDRRVRVPSGNKGNAVNTQ